MKNRRPPEAAICHPRRRTPRRLPIQDWLELSPDLLARLKDICELRGVTLAKYVEALRPHIPNAWRNPAGFMTDFARKIHSKTPGGIPAPTLTRIDSYVVETARCKECGGAGIRDGGFCSCQLGRDLKRMLERSAPPSPLARKTIPDSKIKSVRRF